MSFIFCSPLSVETSYKINTADTSGVRRSPFRVSIAQRKIIEEPVGDILAKQIVRPPSSASTSSVVLVKKRDGSLRSYVDYERLNNIAHRDV